MSIKYWLPLVALLLLAPKPVLAVHSGSAPTDPSKPNDEHFVVDVDSGLDTGCTYREGGRLKFKVGINRYVGKASMEDKLLINAETLKKQKVVSPTIKLVMLAYDIDIDQGEIDEVYFNGHKIGTLQGSNGTWQENEFTILIE